MVYSKETASNIDEEQLTFHLVGEA